MLGDLFNRIFISLSPFVGYLDALNLSAQAAIVNMGFVYFLKASFLAGFFEYQQ